MAMATKAAAAAAAQAQNHNVFVYGSLLADEVVQVLLKRVPASSPAVLPGYHRFSINGRVYPAILPVDDKKVVGRVLMGITNPELNILDMFEDVEYVRDVVEVSLMAYEISALDVREDEQDIPDNSEKLRAHTYIWDDKNDTDLYGEWDFEEWKSARMNDFVKMSEEFAEELEQPEYKSRVETYTSYFQQSNEESSAT